MKTKNNLPQKIKQVATLATIFISTSLAPMLNGLTPAAQATVVKAKRSDTFVDSVCINTHWNYFDTPYGNYSAVKQKLLEAGIRHVRDGRANDYTVNIMKDLAASGIKTTFVIDPNMGTSPNSSYWRNDPSYDIVDFIKNKVGPNVIDAVEILNEMDLFHHDYYWHPDDAEPLNDDPNSSLYWVKYVESMTKDTWNALKSDSATKNIKIIGPSLGRYVNIGENPLPDLSNYVDWGGFHPYPGGGNSYGGYFDYNTIEGMYYAASNFPSVNIDEYPYSFQAYGPPFGGKPMAATETGYQTSTDPNAKGISEKVHGKYMPRLYLEYFRVGMPRACTYEFVDEWNDINNSEANFGLLRNDLSHKPAYNAVKNLLNLLKEPGKNFTPGSLDYNITVNPPEGYDRTQYVHHLLLQKSNGKFFMPIWHEVSNYDLRVTPMREITPPDMPTKIKFNTPISSVTAYTLEENGSMSSKSLPIYSNNTISVNVKDRVRVLMITPKN